MASLTQFRHTTQECQKLKALTPELPWHQGVAFRTPTSPYPTLGLCFLVREASTGGAFGVYTVDARLPEGCSPHESGEHLMVAKCNPKW